MIVNVFDGALIIDESLIEESKDIIERQVREYVEGKRTSFDLSFSFPSRALGQVLREMNEIPYGETKTYGEIAEKLDTAPVAIGKYCSQNPLPLIVPCHRVVGRNDIGGYQAGREVKRKLLELEQD
ncbi:methylated-DNA--[protein]-cysteine S-methyltransferase [Candidatus Nanohalococcus occultus]|uniref:methylated-DNA--[protein]-cysteine S-methyltransferase n=1 Tax=Candidatus Nanohalococcus occultus TaxID=2978047 RepID=UPI0039E087A3